MYLILSIIFGLLFGSFINALVWRIHEGKPIAKDRSECEFCHHKLAAKDLVPGLSYLWLRGKCRYCGKPIAVHNLIVELLAAALFAWSYLAWYFSGSLSQIDFGVWLMILTGLIALAIYDLRWYLLPDKIMNPVLILGALHLAIVGIQGGWPAVLSHLLAATLAGGLFFGLHAIGKGKFMGGGDVKLAFLMGLLLGTGPMLVAMLVAFNSAAIVGLALIAAGKMTRKSLLPFGPFLIGGTYMAMLYGQKWFDAYVNHFMYR